MFDWFIGATPDGKVNLDYGVLKSYGANADATEWTFVLKPGLKWHDGADITSDDIKFTIEYYMRTEFLVHRVRGAEEECRRRRHPRQNSRRKSG